jgi:inner membrane protein
MEAVTGLLANLTVWHWVGLGIILMTLEVGVGTFDLLWIGLGAFATALFALLVPPPAGGWEGQLVFFGLTALAFVIMGRTLFKGLRRTPTSHPNLNDRMASMKGQRGEATQAFAHGQGRVKIGDTEWAARDDAAEGISVGDEITVVGSEGAVLRVRRT